MTLYRGDQNALFEDLEYTHPKFDYSYQPLENEPTVNQFINKTLEDWENFHLGEVHIFNYNDSNMHVALSGHLNYATKFNGTGYRIYRIRDQKLIDERIPLENNRYLDGVKNVLFRLHLGDYGGIGLRIVSFWLGLISCIVILSGIMIWMVARNKNHISEKKMRFNNQVANVYMAICLSMLPVTAVSFCAVKIWGAEKGFIYKVYFLSWLVASLFFTLKKNINFTNKYCLISGGILSILVPFCNGFATGLWPWFSYQKGLTEVLFIDLLFLLIGGICIWAVYIKGKPKLSH